MVILSWVILLKRDFFLSFIKSKCIKKNSEEKGVTSEKKKTQKTKSIFLKDDGKEWKE